MPAELLNDLSENGRNILTKALYEFDAWCRAGNYTLSHEEWEGWQEVIAKLGLSQPTE